MALKVTTFSSKGRVSRVCSYKCKNKVIHLQSDNQMRLFMMLEWEDTIKNIEVNVELHNIEQILTDVDNLKLYKFRDKETGELFQLHTNFLVTLNHHSVVEKQIAISVKSLSELQRKTVIEKLEIERRYWEAKGIRFSVITEKEIDKQFVNNIMWVRDTISDKSLRDKDILAEKLYYFIQDNQEGIVKNILIEFDYKECIKEGTALFLLRYLIADKQIQVDMKKSIKLNEKINKLVSF